MKSMLWAWSLFSLLLSHEAQGCTADADCSGGQVCRKSKNTEEAWRCGGDCIIPKGGYCCVNPDCLSSFSGSSTEK